MPDDITSDVNTDEKIVEELQQERQAQLLSGTKARSPLAESGSGLNQNLLEMSKRGVNTATFSGVERCIRVINAGSNGERHCMGMVVSNNVQGKHCTACQRLPNPGICNPTVINSSMIKLNDKELKELGMESDPVYQAPTKASKTPVPAPVAKRKVVSLAPRERRPKVAGPKTVKIEIPLQDLANALNPTVALLNATLASIYELPVTKFSEAEDIRVVSEKIKSLIKEHE